MKLRRWVTVAGTLLIAGWGSNQFAALLPLYRELYGFTQLHVTTMLGIYVLGLIPTLIGGGTISDRFGRKRATQFAVVLALISSLMLIGGAWVSSLLYLGRMVSGIATGVIMATATSWVKELSQSPYDPGARGSAGPKRAALAMTGGFFLGPVVSGLIAYALPFPAVLPFLAHLVLSIPVLVLLTWVPDTSGQELSPSDKVNGVKTDRGPRWAYPGAGRRFWIIVGFGAPWAFAIGTVSFAVIPQTLAGFDDSLLAYSTLAITCTLGFGVLAQPLAAKLDQEGSAKASLVGMLLVVVGLGCGILTGVLQFPWLGIVANCIMGSAYGVLMSAGLLETQRLSAPNYRGTITGVFYTLAYAGYAAPTVIAFLEVTFDERSILLGIWGISAISLLAVVIGSKKHLHPECLALSRSKAYTR